MAVTATPPVTAGSLLFVFFSLASFAFLFVSLFLNKGKKRPNKDEDPLQQRSPPTAVPPSLLSDDPNGAGVSVGEKKRRKRARKKRQVGSDDGEDEKERLGAGEKSAVGCIYPFSSFPSATQRRIKMQYDQLFKSNEDKALTIGRVGQFVNCLVETRNELQHKSEIIKRRLTITKALLFKAGRSSFDRHRQQVYYPQIYKLEADQKRLVEDAIVYNWLEEQLKVSPAYKTLLEAAAQMESKASSDQAVESVDSEFAEMSFEELLAQEKKDAFWQRNGKLRSCTN